MIKFLEILGRGLQFSTADLIWHWLGSRNQKDEKSFLDNILNLIDNDEAEKAGNLIKKRSKENSSIHLSIAQAGIYLKKNQIKEALVVLHEVCKKQPYLTMALYLIGHCNEILGNEKQALAYYRDCIKFKNFLELPRQRIAAINFKNNQLEKAIKEYEQLINEKPEDILSLILLGYLYVYNYEFDKAIKAFNKAILIQPDNYNTNNPEIEKLILENRIYEALEEIDRILSKNSKRPELLIKKADILQKSGYTEESLVTLEYCLSNFPQHLEASIKMGSILFENSRDLEAAIFFNKALEINEKIVDSYMGLALAQKLKGNKKQSLESLNLASAILPNSAVLFTEATKIYFQRKYDKANPSNNYSGNIIDLIVKAHNSELKSNPQNPLIYHRLGILMMGLRKFTKATSYFESAVNINPQFDRAKIKLILCNIQKNKPVKALDLLKISKINTKEMKIFYKTSIMYCDKVKFASSLINFEKYLYDNFSVPSVTSNISVIMRNLGLIERSNSMWKDLQETENFCTNK